MGLSCPCPPPPTAATGSPRQCLGDAEEQPGLKVGTWQASVGQAAL